MAAPKQTRAPRPASRPGTGKSKDKGTRGGRPEPQSAAAPARRAGNGQRRAGQTGQSSQPAPSQAVTADPGPGTAPGWLQLTTWVLSLAGLGVSVYLTVAHYSSSSILACSDNGLVNCAAVTTSSESMVFGVFPVAVLGLAFYVFMAAVTSPWAWRATWPPISWARFGSVIVGMLFVLYLVYTELFTLDAICLWCTSVHVITFLLFGLIVFSAAAGYGTARAAPAR
ncbi:MAG: vitamin K epoxide reductase family protein [Streptosporangiaceae bacterium]